jgi:hypothetical protein
MGSPAASNDSTVMGRTLPDITLGSLGSSFRSEDEDERRDRLGRPVARGKPILPDALHPTYVVSSWIMDG